ncbi:MAG: ABC transporter substrate-binding protein [Thermodesulfobacteriota bacterium]|nr:ABC transporter substrate-binding protein [Thermodesulfobacteriota bacterium]
MKRIAVLITIVFVLSLLVVPMVMAQAKPTPAKEPAKAPAQAKPVAKPAAPKEPIKLGAIYCFAGPCYMYSESAINGIRIAADEINAKGGIMGRKLDVIVRDTEMKVDVGAREVKDLILREKVNFLEGPCSSGVGLAMQVVHSEYKVIRVTTMANTEGQVVDKFTPYIVQIVPNTYMEAKAATRYLHKKVPTAKKFATINPDYEFGRREFAAFKEEITKLVPDAEILYEAWPKPGEKDFTAFITAIMAKKPDAVHSSLFGGDLVAFTKQAAPYEFFKTPFIALYDLPVLLALGPDAPEGTFGFGRGCFFMDPNPKMLEFVDKYKKVRGAYPDSWAVQAYDGVYLLKAAVEKAKTSETEAVIKAMEGISIDSLRGRFTIRPLDHMGSVPCYQGTIAKDPAYPFKIWKDISRVPGDQVWRSEESVREVWKKTGVVR